MGAERARASGFENLGRGHKYFCGNRRTKETTPAMAVWANKEVKGSDVTLITCRIIRFIRFAFWYSKTAAACLYK